MSHYFSQDQNNTKSNPKVIAFRVNDVELNCVTDHGVFAKDGLDRGTNILLKYINISDHKTALDLGCGYGVVGLYLTKKYHLTTDFVDINERALALTKENIARNNVVGNVFQSDGFEAVSKHYDLIVSNPPIRAGKKVIYQFFEDASKYLTENGEFVIVINKKHGAESALKKLKTVYQQVEVLGREKGFYVIKSKN